MAMLPVSVSPGEVLGGFALRSQANVTRTDK